MRSPCGSPPHQSVIHICGGDVLSLFMNISLACDYRIITTDTVFHNVFQEIGMLPKGGAPFFLSRTVGNGKARELLLLNPRISAGEALESRIADRMVAPEDLEDYLEYETSEIIKIGRRDLFGDT